MYFRNLTLYRFPRAIAQLFEADEPVAPQHFRDCALKPVGPLEMWSRGFIAPYGQDSELFAVQQGTAAWIAIGTEKKILPPATIEKATAERMRAAEERLGLKISGRQRKRYREETVQELLPRALVQPGRTDAYLDLERGFLAIDTTSRKEADAVVAEIRNAFGSFPALPLNAEVAPRAVLTGWLAEPGTLPAWFALGDEVELRDAADRGAVVKMQRKDLVGEEIDRHLENGMQVTRLALVFQDHVSFVIGEDLVVRKFRLLDGAAERLDDAEFDTARQEMDARFALMVGEVAVLFDALEAAFKLLKLDEDVPPAPAARAEAERRANTRVQRAAQRLDEMARDQGITMEVSAPGGESLITFGDGPDPLLATARENVIASGKASISRLQRQLKLGYNRAARLIEALEAEGVVSAPANDGARTVLSKQGSP